MNKDIPVGSAVMLSDDTQWEIGFDNPIGVDGVVTGPSKFTGYIGVSWSNGEKNSYRPHDSDLIAIEEKA